MWIFVCLCVYMCIVLVPKGGQKRESDPLMLEFQVVGSRPMWGLGIELQSFAKATNALNHRAVSLANSKYLK